mgnify:FL=1
MLAQQPGARRAGSFIASWLVWLAAVGVPGLGAQLVDDSVPREADRVTFRVPI